MGRTNGKHGTRMETGRCWACFFLVRASTGSGVGNLVVQCTSHELEGGENHLQFPLEVPQDFFFLPPD